MWIEGIQSVLLILLAVPATMLPGLRGRGRSIERELAFLTVRDMTLLTVGGKVRHVYI